MNRRQRVGDSDDWASGSEITRELIAPVALALMLGILIVGIARVLGYW